MLQKKCFTCQKTTWNQTVIFGILCSCNKEQVLNCSKSMNESEKLLFSLGMNNNFDNQWLLNVESLYLRLTRQYLFDQVKNEFQFLQDSSFNCRLNKINSGSKFRFTFSLTEMYSCTFSPMYYIIMYQDHFVLTGSYVCTN